MTQMTQARVYQSAEEITGYAYVLSGKHPFAKHPDVVILGEKEDPMEAQRVLILGAKSIREQNDVDALYRIFRYQELARKAGHQVEIGFGPTLLIEYYYGLLDQKIGGGRELESQETRMMQECDELIFDAYQRQASDVHIEIRRNDARLKYRIHGNLIGVNRWPVDFALRFTQVVYSVVAEETDVTFNPEIPQDGVIDRFINNHRLRLRLATIPASPDGYDMVLRILPLDDDSMDLPDLESLGYTPQQAELIQLYSARPAGATIISGSTGSGKSTTLKVLLSRRIRDTEGRMKVITVEDPPEYHIPGATQVPVVRGRDVDNAFAAAIRGAMRSDPDILMAGEVRDAASAKLLAWAVQSGHNVMTTIHTISALDTISRLENIGMDRKTSCSPNFINLLIYQALLPILCEHCKRPLNWDKLDKALAGRLAKMVERNHGNRDLLYARGEGCEHCIYGIARREVSAEVVAPDVELLRMLSEKRDIDAMLYWLDNGGQTVMDHAVGKMLAGRVDPRDLEHRLGPMMDIRERLPQKKAE